MPIDLTDVASPLAYGEQYSTVEYIRDVPDRATLPMLVVQWSKPDKPCKILLQALSDEEKADVVKRTAKDATIESALVCLYGIKEPRFTPAQLDILRSKNAYTIDTIAELIYKLGMYTNDTIQTYVNALMGISAPTDDATADGAAAHRSPLTE